MRQVLHYKTNYLNRSETFIQRLVNNHDEYAPTALCYQSIAFTDHTEVKEVPRAGISRIFNSTAFHLNLPLPFYYKVIKKLKPDVIHAHFGFDAVKMIWFASHFNIPLVVSFYGSDVSRLPSEFGWKRRYKKLAVAGSHFIAATQFMKQQLIDLGFPIDKISVVRFGVDLENSPFLKHNQMNHKLMMVGRMVEKKGFKYAIQAVHKLRMENIDVNLHLYGSGPLMPELKELTQSLSLNGSVTFRGYQPIESVLEAHKDYAVMLAPSVTAEDGDMEGLPNTILEAMARGTPVIASRHAAIPEVVEDSKTGFLVDEADSEALAHTLKEIFQNKYDLEQIRRSARQKVEKNYSVLRMVSEIEHIYDELINR